MSLYVAYDPLDGKSVSDGYSEVVRLSKEVRDPNFDMFQVKLIAADDPLAKAAREVYRGRPWKVATRFRGRVFGGVGTDEVYVYPPPMTVPVW